ncbi:unnamed protein product [Peniophora sp. CBMAI 1063]|nr:unnamed protein product [Peniophora sp. CBMAI 1063]
MAAVDPTYPLYPTACILTSVMLLLVQLTSFVRHSWNLGVTFLCFWLFLETLTSGVNAVVWSDNADIKLYVYCDIVSRVQIITSVVKPMATLIITRRLYLIISLQSIEPHNLDKKANRRNLAIEWTLGLLIPLIVAGPLYYVVQWLRFQVEEGFGCGNSPDGSILSILLIYSWSVIPPLVSIAFYYPSVVRRFYKHSREVNQFLRSNNSVSRRNYFRILALASIDVLLTLPLGIANIALIITQSLSFGPLTFYYGWASDHNSTTWEPQGWPYAEVVAQGTSTVAQDYFAQWTSPILAFAIFGLFGFTSEARASYWSIACAIGGWFGWKPAPPTGRTRSPLPVMEFGVWPHQSDSMSLGLGSEPNYVDRTPDKQEIGVVDHLEMNSGERAVGDVQTVSKAEKGTVHDHAAHVDA